MPCRSEINGCWFGSIESIDMSMFSSLFVGVMAWTTLMWKLWADGQTITLQRVLLEICNKHIMQHKTYTYIFTWLFAIIWHIQFVFVLHLPCTHMPCLSLCTAGTGRTPISPSAITAQGDALSPCQSISLERGSVLYTLLAFLFIFRFVQFGLKWLEVQVCVTGCFRLFHFIKCI
jgi:hypothetical protein